MIDIGFINLILIIAENAFGFGKPDNPYFSIFGALGSLGLSAAIVLKGVKLGTVTSDAGKILIQ